MEIAAFLRADGVPRDLLRAPGETDDGAVDRLAAAGVVVVSGDLVLLEPALALTVRLRVENSRRRWEILMAAEELLYAHATELLLRANHIFFEKAERDTDELTVRVRALLDQAVTLAWHTEYTYDRALDIMLQGNACLAELGHRRDAKVLARQLFTLCRRHLGPAHPLSREAEESVTAIRNL